MGDEDNKIQLEKDIGEDNQSNLPGTSDAPIPKSFDNIQSMLHEEMVGLNFCFQRDLMKLQHQYYNKYYKSLLELRRAILTDEPEHQTNRRLRRRKDLNKHPSKSLMSNSIPVEQLSSNEDDCTKHFWLKALMSSDQLVRKMIKKDELKMLKYLIDISCDSIVTSNKLDKNEKFGFQIKFEFSSNPYFRNRRILKRYVIDIYPQESKATKTKNLTEALAEKDELLMFQAPRIVEINGTKIEWKNNRLADELKQPQRNDETAHFDSLIKYLQFSWAERCSQNKLLPEIDYSIGVYFRDVVVVKAYKLFLETLSRQLRSAECDEETENETEIQPSEPFDNHQSKSLGKSKLGKGRFNKKGRKRNYKMVS